LSWRGGAGGLGACLCPEPGPAGRFEWHISGVDAAVGSGVTLGAARGSLNEADGGGPPHGLGRHAGEAGKVALMPVRLEERRDVLGPVIVAGRCPGAAAAAGSAEGAGHGFGGGPEPSGACVLMSAPPGRPVTGLARQGS
jgi:hypothetical protein